METLINPLLDLLHELYVGSDNKETWVIDVNPGHGVTAVIKTLSAVEASMPLVEGGSTIAAHSEHLRWSLYYALHFYKGEAPSLNWEESWKVKRVNEPEWEKLQQDLLEAYYKVKEAISAVTDWSNPHLLKGTLALAPHAAYHLGAIKQLRIAVQNKAANASQLSYTNT